MKKTETGLCPICKNQRVLHQDYGKEGKVREKLCRKCISLVKFLSIPGAIPYLIEKCGMDFLKETPKLTK